MREIKFRGKRIDNGEWVYGNLIYSSDACKEYETLIIPQKDADGFTTDYTSNGENKESYGFDNWFCVIPETVGQYTGLKDKNGKEIYEGDIVCDRWANFYTPIFRNGIYMAYNVKDLHLTKQEPSTQFNVIWKNGCEVIGNIHDNPELLEV